MKLFISYPRKAATDVDRICRLFPDPIRTMLDINTLLIGENWVRAVEYLVSEVDYVLLYINEDAVSSSAMEDELNWILRREKDTGRDILLPVVTDANLLHMGYLNVLRERNYILFGKRNLDGGPQHRTDEDYRSLVMEVLAKLSILLIKERERVFLNPIGPERVSEDDLRIAGSIAQLVYGTNKQNPAKFDYVIRTLNNPRVQSEKDVLNMIRHLSENKILGGVHYVMDGIYEGFDHFKLKALQSVESKKKIAARTADQINNGDIVILDSGSTCNEVAQALVGHIADGMLTGLDVIVCSASAAKPFMDYCDTRLHDTDPIKLYIRGGNVRLRNHAIVAGDSLIAYTDISKISEQVRKGRKVKSFLGCNYFDEKGVFYSVLIDEANNKKQITLPSDEIFILANEEKWLDEKHKAKGPIYSFVDPSCGKNITVIVGGSFPQERQARLKQAGITVLTTSDSVPGGPIKKI